MVQQIASVKTESAASALPFTLSASALSVQNETRQTFNNELLRQSQASNTQGAGRQSDLARNATMQRETASERQTASAQKQNAINEQLKARADEARSKRQDDAEKTARSSNDNRKDDNAVSSAVTYTNSTVGNNRGRATLDFEPEKNSISNETFDVTKLPAELTLEEPLDPNAVNNTPQEKAAAEHGNTAVLLQDSSQNSREGVADQFDYIDYVTQLAEFNGNITEEASLGNTPIDSELGLLSIDKKGLSDLPLINTQKIDAESTDELASAMQDESNANNSLINIELENNHLVTENRNLSVNISSEDLQKIIQMQQAQGTDLSAQDKAELAQIVDDLIQQYEANNVDGSVAAKVSQADRELLASLLIQAPTKASVLAENVQKLPAELVLDNQAFKNANSVTHSSVSGVPTINTEQNSEVLESIKANDDSKLSQVTASIEEPSKKTDLNLGKDDKKSSANTLSLKNIAQLSDEQSKAALESLSSRVQAVVSEISGENKGSEFVAALQSSVKEFKQQLVQGREPGIDLKAIVAEALAQISGETTVTQQPKIDAVLNQFSAVVNLANAVNLSANQQATQVLGVSDTQLAKEFTLGQIEGTKLANGIQNPSNVLSTTDKAINIFKQEGQQQLAEKVRWMVNSKSATAEIRLDPPDLGGINIKINLSGDTAQVNFNVQSAAAKEALDQAVPRLREMLQDHGIELGESVVQQESQHSQQGESSENRDSLAQSNDVMQDDTQELVEENTTQVIQQRISGSVLGGIDYYA